MSSERKRLSSSWLTLDAEDVIREYMNEPDEFVFQGKNGPMVFQRWQPTEEDLAWDEQEIDLDAAKAAWKPDSYDN